MQRLMAEAAQRKAEAHAAREAVSLLWAMQPAGAVLATELQATDWAPSSLQALQARAEKQARTEAAQVGRLLQGTSLHQMPGYMLLLGASITRSSHGLLLLQKLRTQQKKRFFKRNRAGQPLMQYRIEKMLKQLENEQKGA
jgi:hypothetical protein